MNIIKSFQWPIYNWLGPITLTSYLMFDTKPDTNPCYLTLVRVKGDKNLGSGTCSTGIMNCIVIVL
jgi:hypothetical protein